MKEYTLYTEGPKGAIWKGSVDYYHGAWIATVRATGVREAYSLLNRQDAALNPGEPGVTKLDNAKGPIVGWPWLMPKTLAPSNWSLV
jgi:hypothetical protein